MSRFTGSIRKALFGIAPEETSFQRRGFHSANERGRQRLEHIGRVFVDAYHAGLRESDLASLVGHLDQVDLEFRGFAFEGAAMALALLDRMTLWNRHRIRDLLAGPGDSHAYMVHVAIGWVHGRLGGNIEKRLAPLDPLLRWLVVEGYGFHEGFFHGPRYLKGQSHPAGLQGYARRMFDQGLGRCFWFIDGADVNRIPGTIAEFPETRRADLWSGVGLSCVYAGEADEEGLVYLREAAGDFRPQLAQGAAFAAKARQRAGNLVPYTDRACRCLAGICAEDAAYITDAALENLSSSHSEPEFEMWRKRIQFRLRSRPLAAT